MNEKNIAEQLSACVDDELSSVAETRQAIEKMIANGSCRNQWKWYHLIGSVMRGEGIACSDEKEWDIHTITQQKQDLAGPVPKSYPVQKDKHRVSFLQHWLFPVCTLSLVAALLVVTLAPQDTVTPVTTAGLPTPIETRIGTDNENDSKLAQETTDTAENTATMLAQSTADSGNNTAAAVAEVTFSSAVIAANEDWEKEYDVHSPSEVREDIQKWNFSREYQQYLIRHVEYSGSIHGLHFVPQVQFAEH